mgnify:CR=1 FL=1
MYKGRAASPVLRTPVPRVPVTRRDRQKETHNPEVNQPRQITALTHRERTNGDLDPAEQERKLSQAVLFGAMRQTAGVNEGKTPQQPRVAGREPRSNAALKAPTLRRPAPVPRRHIENAQMAISTRGTGTQAIASRPVWRKTNSRRERRQNTATEPHGRRERRQNASTEPHDRRERRQNTAIAPRGRAQTEVKRGAESTHVTQTSPCAAPTHRERTNGDLDPRNRNASHRKPSCLAQDKQQA